MEKKNDKNKEGQVLDKSRRKKTDNSGITFKRLPTGAVEIFGALTFAQYIGLEEIPGLAEC